MPHVPGLRSPYARVGRLVYFGRMLDKIRLHEAGKLPPEYVANIGHPRPMVFDARCCRFLGVPHEKIAERVRAGGTDAEILDWAESQGTRSSDEQCMHWNQFMMKLGWRDNRVPILRERIREAGLDGKPIETFFDFLDWDEGRAENLTRRPWNLTVAQVVVLIGVAGSGKTTIGRALAAAAGWPFRDADDFHPPQNIAKMAAGDALDDRDREPWLDAIQSYIGECLRDNVHAVVTCSALKENYRKKIAVDPTLVKFVWLKGSPELLAQRLEQRAGHFMKPEMLASQLATWEEPKNVFSVDIAQSPNEIVAKIRATLEM